jgi:hypothetical protein
LRSIVLTANLLSFNTNQRSSLFFRLPAEPRNRIYELVFDSTSLRVIKPPLKIGAFEHHLASLVEPAKSFALQHTCHQIALEAFALFISHATFVIHFKSDMETLLKKMGPRGCHAITTFRLSQYLALHLPKLNRYAGWLSLDNVEEFPGLKWVYAPELRALLGDKGPTREEMVAAVHSWFGIADLEVILEK